MAMVVTLNPPEGHTMVTGTWGVDAYLVDDSICGPYGLFMDGSTGTDAKINCPVFAVEGGRYYEVQALLKATRDSSATGATTLINALTYDRSLGALSTIAVYNSGVVPGYANTWSNVGGRFQVDATAAFCQLQIATQSPSVPGNYDITWGNVDQFELESDWSIPATTTTAIAGAWTAVNMTTPSWVVTPGAADPNNFGFLVQVAGLYHCTATVALQSMAVNTLGKLRITDGATTREGGSYYAVVAGVLQVSVSAIIDLAAGSVVGVDVWNGDAVNRNTGTSAVRNYFQGHRIHG